MTDIKVVTEPRVYLVGRQAVDEAELSRFLAEEGADRWRTDTEVAGEKLVEVAGRLCYQSYAKPRPGGNKAYIGHMLESGHGSVIEHSVYNFIITGVSRSFTHQLVRHRSGFSYSQLSQRFCDGSDVAFVVPPAVAILGTDSAAFSLWKSGCAKAVASYKDLVLEFARINPGGPRKTLARKRALEAARSVLPNCTETKIFVTANARALRHFVELRTDPEADAEIRRVAFAVLRRLQAESPNLFGDYTVRDDAGNGPSAFTPYRKV